MVVAEDPEGQPASLEYCQKVKEYYGLKTSVLCDPGHQLEPYGTNGLVLMANSELRLVYSNVGPSISAISTRIELELGLE